MRPSNAGPEPEPDPELVSPLEQHRRDRFEELGFSEGEAEALARARDTDRFPLYWGKVKRMLEHGCTHAGVLAIYA